MTYGFEIVIVDMFTELPTRSGYNSINGFSQPQVEGLLEKAVSDLGIPLVRGYGE